MQCPEPALHVQFEFLLTYLKTRINTRNWEGRFFIEGKNLATTSKPCNDVDGIIETRNKACLADLKIKKKKLLTCKLKIRRII